MGQPYEPMAGERISETARRMVAMANELGEEVTASFNELPVVAMPGGNAEQIEADYHAESRRRHEEWKCSPAGIESARRAEEANRRADAAAAEGILPFAVADQKAWDKTVAVNTDGYGACAVRYAARWANVMEKQIACGATVADCAKAASHEADVEGITGFMYGCAVGILSKAWARGEELRRWHNLDTQIGNEGAKANESGGVLNPALLTIG